MHQFVVFAIPSYGRQPCLEFAMSAMQTNYLLACHEIDSVWLYVGGNPYVHKARNHLAADFLKKYPQATDLFFLDDDLGWPASAALRFLQRPEDVIAGAYPKKDANLKLDFPVEIATDGGRVVMRDGLYKAALIPTGFLRIRRHVVEACAADSGIYPEPLPDGTHTDCWDIFRTGFIADDPGGKRGRWWGEDFFFTVMVRTLGFKVWLDPDIEFTHRGSHVWSGSFAPHLQAWLKANAAPEAAE